MIESLKFTFLARDTYPLTAINYCPDNTKPIKGVVLINPAMGVKQLFYKNFAEFLAQNGFQVYTYDLRGIGLSKPPQKSLKGFVASQRDWVDNDFGGLLDYVRQKHLNSKIFAIGHSLGGQLIGFQPDSQYLSGAITVASQMGYWGLWDKKDHLKMWLVWYFMLPILSQLYGYFPSQMVGMGEDVPKKAALEWAKWCRSENYLFDYIEEARQIYGNLQIPLLALSFSDDSYAPKKAVETWLKYFKSASIEHQHISPSEIGVKSIGHFQFFKPIFEDTLWQNILIFLDKVLKAEN